jgi:formate hydrogenlyase subunit 3/multisubunit Na+/H+ antiporter MnhD subunit
MIARLCYLLGAVASAALVVAGAVALTGHTLTLGLDGIVGFGPDHLVVDRLSGLFLVIAFGAALPLSVVLAATADALAGRYALVLGSVAVILTARNAFLFLFAWEALTIAFYLLARREARAALVTLAFGKISGASLLLGLLMLAARSGSLSIQTFHTVPGGALRSSAYVLLLAGFAVKVGVVPLQVWMPRAYAAAPAPLRAVMAGVAVNVGFYGMWRTLAVLGAPPGWLTGAVLLLAAATAVLGIAHAAVQTDVRRIIAYSSVENTGLIVCGYGVALVGADVGVPALVAAGLLAGTLQIVAHTAGKSLLFATAARFERAAGTAQLDGLRGAGRRLPVSGAGFTVGTLTLAGLPPTAGFAAEWFLLEALMQQFRLHDLAFQLILAVAGAAIALTAGFAAVTFVRLLGLLVFARPGAAPRSPDMPLAGRCGILTLAAATLAVAVVTPLEVRTAAAGLAPIVPAAVTTGALKSPWVLQPIFPGFSILSPSWLWIAMPTLLVLIALFTWAVSGARMWRVRRVPAWRSATLAGPADTGYTAYGFSNPTRRVLATILHSTSTVRPGRTPGADAEHIDYTGDVVEVVESYLYRPLARPVRTLVRFAKRLQSGRLDAYIAYMLIAFIAVIAVVVALA